MPEQPVIMITDTMPMHKIADFISNGYEKLDPYLKKLGALTVYLPFIAYYGWKKMYTEDITVSPSYPTSQILPGEGDIKSAVFPRQKFIVCYYRGGYQEMGSVYTAMEDGARDHHIEPTSDCFEFYSNGDAYDESDFLTKV